MFSTFFQGMNPVVPVFVIVLIFLLSLAISFWSYRHLRTPPAWKKWLLISLRATSLAILGFLLFNPYQAIDINEEETPVIALYMDNSQSIGISRGGYNGLESYHAILESLQSVSNPPFAYKTYLFSDGVVEGDSVDALGAATNIQSVMEHIREYETAHTASIIISDGIHNQGRDPVFAAQLLSSPLFTIPAGDTSTVRDLLIADMNYNETIYTGTRERIELNLQQMGFEGEIATVQLLIDGETEGTQSVLFNAEESSHQVEFIHEFTEPGFYDIEVFIPPKEGEFTNRNNSRSFSLEVIDDKTQVLSLAFEVHPDVRSVRNLAATDQQIELTTATYLGNNRFTGTNPITSNTDFDLLILHGLPDQEAPDLSGYLKNTEIPVIYLSTPLSYSRLTSEWSELTNLSLSRPQLLLDIHIQPWDPETSHPLLEVENSQLMRFPTLKTYRGDYTIAPIAEPLLTAQFQRNDTGIPLLIIEDTPAGRKTTINAFGWYRLEQSRMEEARNFFNRFFTNIISWTATDPDRRTLTLSTLKESFTENEPVVIRANLTNERGEPEPGGAVDIRLMDENAGQERVFRLNHLEEGTYSAQIGAYPQGIYTVEGTAMKDNRVLGEAQTRVHITESSLELVQTKRNDSLLRNLAEITNGLFIEDYDFEKIYTHLEELALHEASSTIRTEYSYLYRSVWWFVTLLFLLSCEWILRKTLSLP